jgi:hypothetical protein
MAFGAGTVSWCGEQRRELRGIQAKILHLPNRQDNGITFTCRIGRIA